MTDKCDKWDFSHGPVSPNIAVENAHLRTEIERLTRERDEALAALQRRADELNVIQGSIAAYQSGELERQVATLREALVAAEESLQTFIGAHGDNGAGIVLAQVRAALAEAKA